MSEFDEGRLVMARILVSCGVFLRGDGDMGCQGSLMQMETEGWAVWSNATDGEVHDRYILIECLSMGQQKVIMISLVGVY